jgi:hypothetical protein
MLAIARAVSGGRVPPANLGVRKRHAVESLLTSCRSAARDNLSRISRRRWRCSATASASRSRPVRGVKPLSAYGVVDGVTTLA